jgi:hypothetical protein
VCVVVMALTEQKEAYIFQEGNTCILGLLTLPYSIWILGDIFMRKYYTVRRTHPAADDGWIYMAHIHGPATWVPRHGRFIVGG